MSVSLASYLRLSFVAFSLSAAHGCGSTQFGSSATPGSATNGSNALAKTGKGLTGKGSSNSTDGNQAGVTTAGNSTAGSSTVGASAAGGSTAAEGSSGGETSGQSTGGSSTVGGSSGGDGGSTAGVPGGLFGGSPAGGGGSSTSEGFKGHYTTNLVVTTTTTVTTHHVPQFGLLVNNLECSFCHLKINGDVASTGSVAPFWENSIGSINGSWFIAGSFNGETPTIVPDSNGIGQPFGSGVLLQVSGGITQQDPSAAVMPKPLNLQTGLPTFPTLDFTTLDGKMQGTLTAGATQVSNVYNGNLVITGTPTAPIVVDGEVLIKGDLVIKGTYTGIGNIYVTGNIYLPGDLLALNSPFPYSTDRSQALEQARAAIAANMDALGLATPGSIVISDFEGHPVLQDGQPNDSVFEDPKTPPNATAQKLRHQGPLQLVPWRG